MAIYVSYYFSRPFRLTKIEIGKSDFRQAVLGTSGPFKSSYPSQETEWETNEQIKIMNLINKHLVLL